MNKQVLNPLLNNKPVSKKILAEHEESKKQIKFNKKTYNKEYKELKFLVETKKADDFTISMYVAIIDGRKITKKMLQAIHNIIKRNSFAELEKKRVETERLIGKTRLVREVLSKCNYDDTYVWRSEEFLDSIDEQIHRWGNLSPKQKLALNKMYQRFKKKSEKKT
tara:strand:- start:91 stop:585 length:495 start_codon:yes stop_codon:yes gene_type:complete